MQNLHPEVVNHKMSLKDEQVLMDSAITWFITIFGFFSLKNSNSTMRCDKFNYNSVNADKNICSKRYLLKIDRLTAVGKNVWLFLRLYSKFCRALFRFNLKFRLFVYNDANGAINWTVRLCKLTDHIQTDAGKEFLNYFILFWH